MTTSPGRSEPRGRLTLQCSTRRHARLTRAWTPDTWQALNEPGSAQAATPAHDVDGGGTTRRVSVIGRVLTLAPSCTLQASTNQTTLKLGGGSHHLTKEAPLRVVWIVALGLFVRSFASNATRRIKNSLGVWDDLCEPQKSQSVKLILCLTATLEPQPRCQPQALYHTQNVHVQCLILIGFAYSHRRLEP
jgi:hypothetical protein